MRSAIMLLLSTCLALAAPSRAQDLPPRAEILATLRLVQGHWVDGHPDPGNRGWARAAYFTGHMALYEVNPRQADLDYARLWADDNGWGLLGGPTTRHADNQCCGQTYIVLDALDPDPLHLADIDSSVLGMVESPQSDDWWWCDALYMAMPVFTRLGVLHDDDRYFEKLHDLYTDTKSARVLYDTTHHLWYRDESFKPPFATPGGEPCFWSRGNGWVFAGHARTLSHLPADDPHRPEYVATFQAMAAALVAVQRPDGFWNVSLADTTDFPGPETSGTAFFAYGLAWGVRHGLLDAATYLPPAASAWQGMVATAVHPDGALGYVQDVGAEPASSQPVTYESTRDFGVGAFLLAGSELFLLADGASDAGEAPAARAVLAPNVPNPFNPRTEIRFRLPAASTVDLAVFDLAGRRIATLCAGDLPPGRHARVWHGRDDAGRPAASGAYVARLLTSAGPVSRVLILAR